VRILHTSDWHLGHRRLLTQDRLAEQTAALDWLLTTLQKLDVDVLLVSGDVFDLSYPPVSATRLYYDFLHRVVTETPCKQLVIIAGNHDAPAHLMVADEFLKRFNIHVVSRLTANLSDVLVVLKNKNNLPAAVVAAVPFIQSRDLPPLPADMPVQDRSGALREQLGAVFVKAAAEMTAMYPGLPQLAMAHLYAAGSSLDGKKSSIYLGDMENIMADTFPDSLQYVALGHIHRAQRVGGKEHIRYSGTLLPLDFGESENRHSVCVFELRDGLVYDIRHEEVPVFRLVRRVSGPIVDVEEAISQIGQAAKQLATGLEPWIAVELHNVGLSPMGIEAWRKEQTEKHGVTLVLSASATSGGVWLAENDQDAVLSDLSSFTPAEVFKKRLETESMKPSVEDKAALNELFEQIVGKIDGGLQD